MKSPKKSINSVGATSPFNWANSSVDGGCTGTDKLVDRKDSDSVVVASTV